MTSDYFPHRTRYHLSQGDATLVAFMPGWKNAKRPGSSDYTSSIRPADELGTKTILASKLLESTGLKKKTIRKTSSIMSMLNDEPLQQQQQRSM
jgi:hypothetical protein